MRARRDRERDKRRRERHQHVEHISLDAFDPDKAVTAEIEASLAVASAPADQPERDQDAEMLGRRLAEMRALAIHDPHAERVLDAIDKGGARRSSDIKRASGLATLDYRNARRRLTRLAAQLDPRRHSAKKGSP